MDGERELTFVAGEAELSVTLALVAEARGMVVFAHGSGSSRFSPRNRFVAGVLKDAGFATALIDLVSAEEERVDQ